MFRSGRNGGLDLYLMNADGSNVRRLTNDGANDLFPVFSPSANQIAFASNRDNPKSDIFDVYLLDLDANSAPGNIRRITQDEGQHGHLQYSYDRKWLIFASERGGISDEQPIAPSNQLYGEAVTMPHRIEIAKAKLCPDESDENWPCLVLCIAAVDSKKHTREFFT